MNFGLGKKRVIILWQLLFMLLGTTWLWAPHVNHLISYRTALISQYEAYSQPYSWLFRLGDVAAASLLILMALVFIRLFNKKVAGYLLLTIGVGGLIDPLVPTTCHVGPGICQEYVSAPFIVHAVETVITSSAFFIIAIYDSWLRKRFVSIAFVGFQIIYFALFVTQLASQDHFNTVSQYLYQTILVVWVVWFCRDILMTERTLKPARKESQIIKYSIAAWAFINGLLAIVVSLAHLHLLGKVRGLYFTGDSAWLAQHGVIIGVVMLYLSRRLVRGELRARQIFLVVSGIETLKYSVVSPSPSLMLLYLLTFCALFVLRDDFDRGVVPLTWSIRLRDLYFMIGGLLIATLVALLALDRDSKASLITSQSLDNLFDYVARSDVVSRSHLRSALLAHTISAFLAASIASILWILFKPYKATGWQGRYYDRVEQYLKHHSGSSEDYFKLWPPDKDYFWQATGAGFVAYKAVGSIAFALADPVSNNRSKTLEDFIMWARGRRLTPCFLPVYEKSLKMYKATGFQTLQVGSSALVEIQKFLNETSNDKWWRWQRNRAKNAGFIYGESSPPHSAKFLQQLKIVSDAWLTKAGRLEQGFAMGYFEESYLQNCIVHYLKNSDGKVLAFTNQIPQYNTSEIVTVDLLRHLPDVNNAMTYLLYKTIEAVSEDKTHKTFDLGFVPFAKASGPILTIAKTLSGDRFSAKGLEQFKGKFNPDWRPNYIAYQGDLGDLAIIALNLEKVMEKEN